MARETRSLWEQFDSEVEPWRRGRTVLVSIGVCYFLLQALVAVAQLAGSFEELFVFVTGCVIFWLQFYFIWIGVHWIRWFAGGWAGIVGFCWLIWGIRDNNVVLAAFGTLNLFVATYFCFSSSVHFFANRQREQRNWFEVIAVAAVFGLLLSSFLIGSVALSSYKKRLETEARDFANDTFARVFTARDIDFFLNNLTESTLKAIGGRDTATRFLERTRFNPGQIDKIQPAAGQLRMIYNYPTTIGCIAEMSTNGTTIYGRVQLHLRLVSAGGAWQIEGIWWNY